MGCCRSKSDKVADDPTTSSQIRLPLAGVRVVDFGQFVAGPMCGKMLLDQGADVVHIGPPGGPKWNSQANSVLSRGKYLVTLDLKDAKDQLKAKEYISKADIVIENFPPGRMDKFGLGAEAMMAAHPGLIYISIPGFASGDEEFKDVKAHEHVIMARAGVFWDMGISRSLRGVNPSYSPLPLASSYAGIMAGACAAAALYAREDTGIGDHIEIPLASALMDSLCFNTLDVDDLPRRYWGKRTEELFRRRRDAIPMNMTFEQCENMLDPFYKTYYCKDGRPFYIVGMGHLKHVARTLKVLDCEAEVLKILPYGDLWAKEHKYEGDSVLGQYHLREPYSSKIIAVFKEKFKQKTAWEWEEIFGAIRVPTSATRTTKEWVNSPHAKAAGLMVPAPATPGAKDGVMGTGFGKDMLVPGPLVWLSGSSSEAGSHASSAADFAPARGRAQPAAVPLKPAPAKGQGTGKGYLQGIKIIDLSNVIACPMVGVLTGRFGAEVIKIDLPKPAYGPVIMVGFGVLAMRGKKSTLLDLSTPDGYKAFARLVKWADVVTFNGVDPQLEALNITLEALQKINPKVILFHLNSFGGPKKGPRTNCIGYDDLTQSTTGIMARFGGSLETAEEHAHIGTVDVVTGFGGAFAVILALLKRRRTGSAEMAQTSLASVGQMVQVPYCFDGELRGPWDEPKGECVGEHTFYHSYKCKDDVWGFLAATGQHPWPRQVEEVKKSFTEMGIPCNDVPSLSAHCATQPFEELHSKLKAKGVTFMRIGSFNDLDRRPQPENKTFRFVKTLADQNPSGRDVTYFGNSVRSRNWQIQELPELPKYGRDTRAVLLDVCGLPPRKVDSMLAGGKSASSSLGDVFPDSSGVWELGGVLDKASSPWFPGKFWCASAMVDSHTSAAPEDVAEKLALQLGLTSEGKLKEASLLMVFATSQVKRDRLQSIVKSLAAKCGSDLAVYGGHSQTSVATEAGVGSAGVAAFVIADTKGRYASGEGQVLPGGGDPATARGAGKAAAEQAMQRAGFTAEKLKSEPPAFALFSAAATGMEEQALMGVQDILGETPIFGGTCGDKDDGSFVITPGLAAVSNTVCVTLAWPTVPTFTRLSALHSDIIAEGTVTKTSNFGRTIETIDGKPAFDVYKTWSVASGRSPSKGVTMHLDPDSAKYPLAEPHKDASGAPCYKMLLPRTGKAGGSLELFTSLQDGDKIAMMKSTKDGVVSSIQRIATPEPLAEKGVAGGLFMMSAGIATMLGEEGTSEAVDCLVNGLKGCPLAAQLTLGQVGPAGYRDRTTGELDSSQNGPNSYGNLMLNVLLFGVPEPPIASGVNVVVDAVGGLTDKVTDTVGGLAEKVTDTIEPLTDKVTDVVTGLADKVDSRLGGLADKVDNLADKVLGPGTVTSSAATE